MRGTGVLRASVGLAAAFALTGVIAAATAASTGASNPYSKLFRKAERSGSVKVIVELESVSQQRMVLDRVTPLGADVGVRYRLFPLLALEVSSEALARLAASPEVAHIQEDRPEPPTLDSTIPVINADDVQDLGFDGAGQTVAILDTGIDDDHPFFGSRIVSQACYSDGAGDGDATTFSLCPGGATSSTAAGSADVDGVATCLDGGTNICDHGSHVAGIAAGDGTGVAGAPNAGVAPGGNIIAVQVFTRFNQASDCSPNAAPCVKSYPSDQILGLQRVLALNGTFTIAAANMSLGGGSNASACDGDTRKTPIDNLLAAGIATVISAGNNGFLNAVGAPGCISTAVTVGATEDDDDVAGFSNRGPLLDLFAPGDGVDSSVPDDTYANFDGTSMAAPHVTGAYAVLRDAYPSATIATLLGYLQSTGVAITYSTGGSGSATTPRIDLLAALQAGNAPPTVTADNASVVVNEGATATNTGTYSDPEGDPVVLSASRGTVLDTGSGTWSWSFDTNDGPTQSGPVTITATDDKAESGSATFGLTVNNVAPSVTVDPAQDTSISEGQTSNALFDFTDPGWADTYSSTFSWGGFLGTLAGITTVVTQGPPLDIGTATSSKQYGDDGGFTVSATVTDDDGDSGSDSFVLAVSNVNPTATIDLTGTTLINGVPTFVATEGVPVPFSGRSTDPGSDDLTLTWSWGDGAPVPDVATLYLNDAGLNPDPDPSPSVNPRDVTDGKSHAFSDACFYTVVFDSRDDDAGNAVDDSVAVIIGGTASQERGPGYWQTQFRPRPTALSEARRLCYLAIVRHVSTVFSEERLLNTLGQAFNVMTLAGNGGSESEKLDRALLTAWLNFANGAFGYDELVDTDGGGPDTAFSAVMAAAEAVRVNPASTEAELRGQRIILQRINGS
ncbi:MAG: S8 family serine peptidase [Gaiellaceae bacterium]